jgi:hypothetical protein
MTTSIDRGFDDDDMHAPARASRRTQSPGFQRIRIGELSTTADNLHGSVRINVIRHAGGADVNDL